MSFLLSTDSLVCGPRVPPSMIALAVALGSWESCSPKSLGCLQVISCVWENVPYRYRSGGQCRSIEKGIVGSALLGMSILNEYGQLRPVIPMAENFLHGSRFWGTVAVGTHGSGA